ncbi:MAG: metallophosphoesterase [Thiotrichaceae bacterium]|nr:metallophosphoesterase [Thiotrichaceae bacterium]
MSNKPFKFFPENKNGRDFVVGDIHGMFPALEELLEDHIHFDTSIDRLFCVGDLIDRGPESHRITEFLAKPWFHSIIGNHEVMLLESEHSDSIMRSWIVNNGGEWWENVDEKEQKIIRDCVRELPLAIEVATRSGNIGILHADIPPNTPWQTAIKNLSSDQELSDYVLWSRNRHRQYKLNNTTDQVEGIDLLILGHTPVDKPLYISNICYLDTGAIYRSTRGLGTLSVLEIQPRLKLYQISTKKKKKVPWL